MRQYSIVKLKESANFEKKEKEFIFLGEIPNMPNHFVIAEIESGKIISGVHLEDFEEFIYQDEEEENDNIIKGFDYDELCKKWGLKFKEFSNSKKERADYVLKKYLIKNNLKLSEKKIKDIRFFLKKLAENSIGISYSQKIFLEMSKIESNEEMLDWFKDNIKKLWI